MTSPTDIVRYIDTIARDKEIDREGLFTAVEQAVAQALSRKYGIEDLELELNRESGQWVSNYEISMENQGRILAQAVKQAIIARVREAERSADVASGKGKRSGRGCPRGGRGDNAALTDGKTRGMHAGVPGSGSSTSSRRRSARARG